MKKIIGFILTAVLCLLINPAVYVSAATSFELEEAKQAVGAIGEIAPQGKTITRRDFAVMLHSVMVGADGAVSGKHYFHDVAPDDADGAALDTLAEMGIISGGSGQLFRPNDDIKPAEAVKILVASLGRSALAEAQGGYPAGYMKQAQIIRLLSGLNSLGEPALSRDEAIVMVYRAMDTEMLRESTISENETVMAESGRTLLATYRGIVFCNGVVKATELSGLGGTAAVKNHIVVGSLSLYCDKGSARNYLGHHVKAYYRDDDVREVCVILDDRRRNEIKTVNAEDVSVNVSEHSLEKLTYTDEKGTQKVQKISQEADFIYNGVLDKGMHPSDFMFDSGYIELLDNDADGVTDLVSIRSFEHYVIEMIDTKRQEIRGRGNKGFSYGSREGVTDIFNTDGSAVEASTLTVGEVVSVAESRDGKMTTVWRSRAKAEGGIEELENEGAKQYAVINGERYAVDKNYAETTEWQQISAGAKGVFSLNILNEIVHSEISGEEGVQYAFLLEADVKGSLESNLRLRVLTEDGVFRTLEGAEKIRMNGGKATGDHAEIFEMLKCGDALVRQQIIKISLNDADEVKSIDIPEVMDEWDGSSQFYRTENKQFVYLNGPSLLSNYYVGNCKVYFNIEREESRMGPDHRIKEEDIFVSKAMAMHSNYRYYCTMYDFGHANYAQMCVVEPYATTEVFLSKMLVADRVVTTADKDGRQVRKLYGWYNGYAVSYVISDVAEIRYADQLTNITRGDIFRFNFSKNNGMEIGFIRRLYKSSDPWTEGITPLEGKNAENPMVSKYGTATGTVYALDYPAMALQINGGQKYAVGANSVTSVYVYDETADRVYASSFDEIRSIEDTGEGSRVAIYTEYGLIRDVLIIKSREAQQ